MQQGDVLLFQTDDDGEILVEGGVVEMTGGLEVAAYLALFGGNEQGNGLQENPFGWWGNISETDPSRRYVSETQNLLLVLPVTTGNLRRIEDAARRDLLFFTRDRIASTVEVVASIPGLNKIKIDVVIVAQGVESTFSFTENWKAATNGA